MQGEIIRIYDSNENEGSEKKAGKVITSDLVEYNIYQLPEDIRVGNMVEFHTKRSQAGNEYAVFEQKVETYYERYVGSVELEAIQAWIDTIAGLRDRVSSVEEKHQVGHDFIILFNDGSKTIVEVKNEENYWYERTGNITLDAISAFSVENTEIQEYIASNRNWIAIDDYQRFVDGINIMRRGSLYESDADIMVKRIIGGDFVKAYDMQRLKSMAGQFESLYRLRVNDKERYGIYEKHKSATYCIPPSDLQDYEINSYDEIPRRND